MPRTISRLLAIFLALAAALGTTGVAAQAAPAAQTLQVSTVQSGAITLAAISRPRLEIRYPGIRGWWGPNGLELRFNNYLTQMIAAGGIGLTVYLTNAGSIVVSVAGRYASEAKVLFWLGNYSVSYFASTNKCLGYTLPIYWWGPNWSGQRYWVENC